MKMGFQWSDISKLATNLMPLYSLLTLGYFAVKWWKVFCREDECDSLNKLAFYFQLPFFTFHVVAGSHPSEVIFHFMAADVISKLSICLVLGLWAYVCPRGSFGWSITCFSLSSLTNPIILGVPIGRKDLFTGTAADLIVQASIIQNVVWLPVLLSALEFWQIWSNSSISAMRGRNNDLEGVTIEDSSNNNTDRHIFKESMKKAMLNLARNPNILSCFIAFAWALISNRFGIEMPPFVQKSVESMSTTGAALTIFNMGVFMGLQENLIACERNQAILGMVLKFVVGPVVTAAASVAMGLEGDVLRIAILQAAIPPPVTAFAYAKEYNLYPEVVSTVVFIGTVAALPVTIAYYATLWLFT